MALHDWWDGFMESNDMWNTIEQSCYFRQEMEGNYNAGYESGMESGAEFYYEDFMDQVTEWKYKLVNFLKDKWVNLNKEQMREVEDYLEAYPILK